jgi:hypothetical protein
MLPIHIFDGSERYVLVRGGRHDRRGERVAPARARALLEAALRRQDPQLIQELSVVLHMRGEDPEQVAAQALARLAATGTIGADLVLIRAQQAGFHRGPRAASEPEAPEAPPPEPPEEEEEEEPPPAKTTIRISLYFDGTANNRANTRARIAKLAEGEQQQDDETNVSRLEMLASGDATFEHSYSIYVEGIGTLNGKWDSIYGKATGMGARGVVGKVERGVDELLKSIRELGLTSGVIIERIHLDAFGFSRGAAAARHFVHFVLNGDKPLQPRIEALGHTVELLEINFVGLFDTVASFGVNHDTDTADLNLDAIQVAKQVLHLAAAEEHREKFRLTDITSAIGAGVGVEIYMPGVHSDVGGGYAPICDEVKLQILDFDQFSNDALRRRFERERDWLIATGWYLPAEIHKVNFWNELEVTRRGIRSDYNRIPLGHMADFAMQSGLTFEPPSERFPIPDALAEIAGAVAAHVAAHLAGATSTAERWIDDWSDLHKQLRHDYLHFSAYYGSIGMAPQFSAGGAMNGTRKRIVQPG